MLRLTAWPLLRARASVRLVSVPALFPLVCGPWRKKFKALPSPRRSASPVIRALA